MHDKHLEKLMDSLKKVAKLAIELPLNRQAYLVGYGMFFCKKTGKYFLDLSAPIIPRPFSPQQIWRVSRKKDGWHYYSNTQVIAAIVDDIERSKIFGGGMLKFLLILKMPKAINLFKFN